MELVKQYNAIKDRDYEYNWIGLLTQHGNKAEFIDIFKQTRNVTLSIMKYRNILFNRGYGNMPYKILHQVYIQQNYNMLHHLLQELFLEYITDDQFQFILDKLQQHKDNLYYLYQKHMNNKQRRILNIILTL